MPLSQPNPNPNPQLGPQPDPAAPAEAPDYSFAALCAEIERAVALYISQHTPFDGPRPLASAQITPYGLPGLWGLHTHATVKGEHDFRLRLEVMPRCTVADLDPMTDQPRTAHERGDQE